MDDLAHTLFWKTWRSWSQPGDEPHTWIDIACREFNFVEAGSWFVFALLVLARWYRQRHSSLELWYSLAFVLFGISDLIEAWVLTSWLLWWKVINLVALFLLRRHVMRKFYPDAKLF
ncbi:MAG TPA: hypothetical protein VGM98_18020 [Schlesneria sp.]|jgi:hypothetical protein